MESMSPEPSEDGGAEPESNPLDEPGQPEPPAASAEERPVSQVNGDTTQDETHPPEPENETSDLTEYPDKATLSPVPVAEPPDDPTVDATPSPTALPKPGSEADERAPTDEEKPIVARLAGASGGSYANVAFEGVFDEGTGISLRVKNNGI